jgi:hypothetical protein
LLLFEVLAALPVVDAVRLKMERKISFCVYNREAIGDNGAAVLNIDGAKPGVIYAYVDEDVYVEISEQLSKRADTTDVLVPHREGRAVDCVVLNSSLREMFSSELLPFENDAQIDAWARELESLAVYLRQFKAKRREQAARICCAQCLHSLLDHEPDLICRRQDCDCRGFFPIESKTLN